MKLDRYCNSSASDRFHGEYTSPPLWEHCEYCGAKIYDGEEYYDHDGLHVCDGCAKRYAWRLFLQDAKRRTAGE